MDGDGEPEVGYFTPDNHNDILHGKTGAVEKTLSVQGEPVAMAMANLRRQGDRDILLQYSQICLKAIRSDDGTALWETDEDYQGMGHSPLRQADVDGDGLDDVANIIPGLPLEVALAGQRGAESVFWNDERNGNRPKARYWAQQHYRRQKQNWNYYSP